MIHVFKTKDETIKAVADLFVQAAQEAVKKEGRFTVALTGGSSPATLYQLLATSPYTEMVDWQNTYVFWGDERWVPLDDEKSNARMSYLTLLNHVPIPKENVYPMWAEGVKPEVFAADYEQQLRKHFGSDAPAFDLILLGMGDDGHTASLFPGTAVVHEQTKWVDAYFLQAQDMYRITLTAPLINLAKRLAVLLFGEGKADALHQVLEGPYNPDKYPSQLLKPVNGELHWFMDEAAAEKLKR